MGQEASTAAGTNEAGGKPRAPRKPQRAPQAAEGFGLDNVKLKDEYAWWSLSAVTAAFDRAKESNSRFLTRNEFWQIFTDYTVLTLKKKASAPTFLCLSLDVFNLFAVEMAGTGILEPIVPPPGSEEPPPPPPQPKPLPSPTNDRPSSAASQRSTSSRASASRPAMLRRQASKRAALQRSSSSRSLRRGASTRSLQASPSSEGGQSSKVPEAKHSEGGEGPATDEPAVDAPGGTGGNVASPENDERKASDSKSDAPATPPLAPAGVGKIGLLRKKLQRAGKRAAARALVAKTWVLPMPRVDVFEIVLVLALFCQGDVGAKLKWMFRVFDKDASGSITQDEMFEFIRVLCSASVKIGVLKDMPTNDMLEVLTAKMFQTADDDNSGTITATEFAAWAQVHILAKGILTAYDSVRREAERNKSGSTMLMASGEETNDKVSALDRVRALNKVMLATKAMLRKFKASKTEFTVESLRELRKRFMEVAGNNIAHPDELTKKQFVALMHAEYPFLKDVMTSKKTDGDGRRAKDDDVVQYLFAAFDTDRSGTISFKELTLGMSRHMSGDFKTKLALLFEAFAAPAGADDTAERQIYVSELQDLVKANNEEFCDVAQFTEDTISAMDKDNSGTVSLDEFTQAVKTKPVLFQCIVEPGGQPQPLTNFKDAVLNESVQLRDVFTMDRLRDAWERATNSTDMTYNFDALNLTAFRKFMVDEFQCPQHLLPFCNRMFDALDSNQDGYLSRRELFSGLAKIMDGDNESKSSFVFKMFDADGSGEMDLNEIMALVISTQENVSQTSAEASRLLHKLDANGDGVVSLEEFEQCCKKEPQLLECFGQMFGSSAHENMSSASRAKKVASKILKKSEKERLISEQHAEQAGRNAMRRLSLFTAGRVVNQLMATMKSAQDGARRAAMGTPPVSPDASGAGGGDGATAKVNRPMSPSKGKAIPQWSMRKKGDAKANAKVPMSAEEIAEKAKHTGAVTRAVGRAYGALLSSEMSASKANLAKELRQQAIIERQRRQEEADELRRQKFAEAAAVRTASSKGREPTFGERAAEARMRRMVSLRATAHAMKKDLDARRERAAAAAAAYGSDSDSSEASSASSDAPSKYYGSSNSDSEEESSFVSLARRRRVVSFQLPDTAVGTTGATAGRLTDSHHSLKRSATAAVLRPSASRSGKARGAPVLSRKRSREKGLSRSHSAATVRLAKLPTRGVSTLLHAASPLRATSSSSSFRFQGAGGMSGSPLARRSGRGPEEHLLSSPTASLLGRDSRHDLPRIGQSVLGVPKRRGRAWQDMSVSSASLPSEPWGNAGAGVGAAAPDRSTLASPPASSAAKRWGDGSFRSKSQLTQASSMRHGYAKRSLMGRESSLRALSSMERQGSVTGRALRDAMAKTGSDASHGRGRGHKKNGTGRYRFVDVSQTLEGDDEDSPVVSMASFFGRAQLPTAGDILPQHSGTTSVFGSGDLADDESVLSSPFAGGESATGSPLAMQTQLRRGLAVLDAVSSSHQTAAAVHRGRSHKPRKGGSQKFVAPKASALYR